MLLLKRLQGERIMIGDDIVITVCEVASKKWVRLGVEAPRDVTVHREEIYKLEQQRRAKDA